MEFIEYAEPIVLFKDDVPCTDVGIKVYKSNILSAPSRKLESIDVEGRNGTLTLDYGYDDFILELECALVNENEDVENMAQLARRAKKYLLSGSNCKLQTNEDMDFYLLGTYSSSVDIEEAIENFGIFQAQFRCKPFRFSARSNIIEITEQNTIINNTEYECGPVISILGTGDITVKINNQELVLKDLEGNIVVNCDEMNATAVNSLDDIVNANHKMYSDFPVLEEGANNISWILGEDATLDKITIDYRLVVL